MDKTFKFKKAILIAVFALVAALCAAFTLANLAGNTKTARAYDITGSGTEADPWASEGQTAWADGTTLYLNIPSTATVKDDITTKSKWQVVDYYKSTITGVVFNDDCALTTIRSCFEGFSSLTSIVIPDSVTNIESYAFSDCLSLSNVILPDNLTYIAANAFLRNSFETLTIPAGCDPYGTCFISSHRNSGLKLVLSATDLSTISPYGIVSTLDGISSGQLYIPKGATSTKTLESMCEYAGKEIVKYDPIGVSMTISQDYDLSMNYYINDDSSIKFFADAEMTEELNVTSTTADGNKKYTLPVSPNDINKTVFCASYDADGNKIQTKACNLKKYLAAVAEQCPAYADLANTVTGYGYSVKNYMGEKISDSDAESLPTSFSEAVTSNTAITSKNANNKFTSAQVMFGNEFGLKIYFVTNAEDYEIALTVAGESVGFNVVEEDGELYAIVEGLKPYNINDRIEVKLYINGRATATSTLTYSITDYCVNISKVTKNPAMLKLVYATYNMYAAVRDAIAAAG